MHIDVSYADKNCSAREGPLIDQSLFKHPGIRIYALGHQRYQSIALGFSQLEARYKSDLFQINLDD